MIGVTQFLSLLIELTADEALVKYGFRYARQEDWGRFHRVVRVTFRLRDRDGGRAGVLIDYGAVRAPGFSDERADRALLARRCQHRVDGVRASDPVRPLRHRGAFPHLGMALRLIGLAAGAPFGVTTAVLGLLVAQLITTASIAVVGYLALRFFLRAAPVPLGDDGRSLVGFVVQSSLDTGLDAFRIWIAPLALGIVGTVKDVGLFSGAQAPQYAFAVLSSPVRMILISDQTRDWEAGRVDTVVVGLRRNVGYSAMLMAAILLPAELIMPWLVRLLLGEDYAPAPRGALRARHGRRPACVRVDETVSSHDRPPRPTGSGRTLSRWRCWPRRAKDAGAHRGDPHAAHRRREDDGVPLLAALAAELLLVEGVPGPKSSTASAGSAIASSITRISRWIPGR